jgi:hypothetical protein
MLQHGGEVARLAALQVETVDHLQGVVVLSHVQARDGAPGAAHGVELAFSHDLEPGHGRE